MDVSLVEIFYKKMGKKMREVLGPIVGQGLFRGLLSERA